MSTSIETQNKIIAENNLDPAKIKELQPDNMDAIEQLENVIRSIKAHRNHFISLSDEFGFENFADVTTLDVSESRIQNVINYMKTGELKEEVKIYA